MDAESLKKLREGQDDEIKKERARQLQEMDQAGPVNKDCRDFARFLQAKHPAIFVAFMNKIRTGCPSLWEEYLAKRKERKRRRKHG